jgi:hypothetical protein
MATASPLGVFINCPFDSEYQKYFDAIVFAVTRLGFAARCAREVDDGSGTRIDKIIKLIKECPYGIHDLSRMGLDPASKLPRFNMPFELGIFIGVKHYGPGPHKKKQCLILDRDNYRYQMSMSDIAGQDIHAHGDKIPRIIAHVRDFLQTMKGERLPGGAKITADFKKFQKAKIKLCQSHDLDPKKLTFIDLNFAIGEWIIEDRGVIV